MSLAHRRPAAGNQAATPALHPLDRLLAERRPIVMGILNLTPDSFADGGRFVDPATALAHAKQMIADGADIVDVGGESTRPYPGMHPVSADEEWARLMPVLPQVVALGVPVSIDTMKAEVAARALASGAAIVNDVWGLQRDPAMAGVVATHQVPVVVTHNREAADPAIDILADIEAFFSRSLEIAARAGIARHRIVLDPGIGFGKSRAQNFTALAKLATLKDYGLPILVGVSRKSLLAEHAATPVDKSLVRTLAANLAAAANGASIFRVHDAAEHAAAFKVFDAIARR
jgi:dihydropteroate synthase